jgi:hypothetical protein
MCGKCGNNCCNGGYGTLEDGSTCDMCPSAYDLQDQGNEVTGMAEKFGEPVPDLGNVGYT